MYEIKVNQESSKVTKGESFKSITTEFQCEKLSDFCILSGYNGAGKTQFFEALVSGFLMVEGIDRGDICLFNYTNFLQNAKNELKFSFKGGDTWIEINRITDDAIKDFEPKSVFGQNHWRDVFIEAEQKWEDRNREITTYSRLNYASEYDPEYKRIHPFRYFRNDLNRKIHSKNPMLLELTKKITENQQRDFFLLESSEFIAAVDSVSLEVDLFSNSFATVCSEYSEKVTDNRIRGFLNSEGGNFTFLTDREFRKLHGPPPWETFQEFLDHAGMPYRVSEPKPIYERNISNGLLNRSSITPFKPNLVRKDSGVIVAFTSLSSGEMILISLAMALFNERATTHQARFPKMILLDEVDAPLHPQRIPELIRTVREFLVKRHSIKVIMATHAPTTVALAEDQDVFIMEPMPPRIFFSGRARCLRYLSVGLPKIAQAFDQRKQVFVESYTDAYLYNFLYEIVNTKDDQEISLGFIEVGHRDDNSEKNAGCEQVKRIVKQLRSNGNNRVYGIIDWDGINTESDGIFVIGESKRYTIENIILDPLLIGATLIHMGLGDRLNLGDRIRFRELYNASDAQIQSIVEAIEDRLAFAHESSRTKVDYIGGQTAFVSRKYLEMNGKTLGRILLENIQELNRFRNIGGLMKHITTVIAAEIPALLPREILDIFSRIHKS